MDDVMSDDMGVSSPEWSGWVGWDNWELSSHSGGGHSRCTLDDGLVATSPERLTKDRTVILELSS